jgi:dTDP-4-dehydrorhamnose reductase
MTPSRVLVVGGEGQLGRVLVAQLGGRVAWSGGRAELDIRDGAAVARRVAATAPDAVINAAAYNHVDGAEAAPGEALAVNAAGPAHLARACRAAGVVLVHVSSDYVFDGTASRPYAEDDPPRPLSAYGVSKLAGELMVAASGAQHLVVRTSGVLGRGGSRVKGGSFVERVLDRARGGQPLRVVSDQVFAPTLVGDLARAIVALLDRGARGVVHVANSGFTSWHGLAEAALRVAGIVAPVEPIRSADLGAPARRPAYSVLSTERLAGLGVGPLRPWQDALAELLA